jgi:tetratricopeptide (TPR) repeat protein
MYLSSRPAKTPEGEDVIYDATTYNDVLKKAEALSRKHFEDYDAGKALTDADLSDLAHAARLFDTMNRFEPTKTGPYIGAGKSYQILGENEVADERLRQCIGNAQYDQSDAGKATVIEAKYLLSVVYGQEGLWQQAYDIANEAVHDVPASAPYLTARASAEIQLKRPAEAKVDLEKALVLYSNYARAERLLKLINVPSNMSASPTKPAAAQPGLKSP